MTKEVSSIRQLTFPQVRAIKPDSTNLRPASTTAFLAVLLGITHLRPISSPRACSSRLTHSHVLEDIFEPAQHTGQHVIGIGGAHMFHLFFPFRSFLDDGRDLPGFLPVKHKVHRAHGFQMTDGSLVKSNEGEAGYGVWRLPYQLILRMAMTRPFHCVLPVTVKIMDRRKIKIARALITG